MIDRGALVVLAAKVGILRKTGQNGNRTGFLRFSSKRVILFKEEIINVYFIQKAPDIVLNLCTHILINNQSTLNPELRDKILRQNEGWVNKPMVWHGTALELV